ncbi:hypothetical protein llap_18501 [Limosa lapponica baueri]|uniref:Uncharacterized protein n=1 Tax=Limosa lapponica baueri TaxID=1758121 RepID=A0A2I0TBM9_LIMLA|nr:hypothetical protein llap_18501 [Limosa lapponica baueri]
MAKAMVKQAVPMQPMEDPMLGQVDVPEGGCDPVESLCWSRSSGRTCDPVGDPCWSSLKNCNPVLEKFVKDCLLFLFAAIVDDERLLAEEMDEASEHCL